MTTMQDPAKNAAAVALDDPMTGCRAIYVGGDGNVNVTMEGGGTVTFVGALAGSILTIRAAQVNAAGTTATNLVALY